MKRAPGIILTATGLIAVACRGRALTQARIDDVLTEV
jgi:hypothetical protein